MHIRIHRSIDANAAAFICSQDSFPVTTDSCARSIYVSVRVHRLVSFPDMGDYEVVPDPRADNPSEVEDFPQAVDCMLSDHMSTTMCSPTSIVVSVENFDRFNQRLSENIRPKYQEVIPEEKRDNISLGELVGLLMKITHDAERRNALRDQVDADPDNELLRGMFRTLNNNITLAYDALCELLFWAGYTHFLEEYHNCDITDREIAKILMGKDLRKGYIGLPADWSLGLHAAGNDERYRYVVKKLSAAVRGLLSDDKTPDVFRDVIWKTDFFNKDLKTMFETLSEMEMGDTYDIATALVDQILYAGGYTHFGSEFQ